MIPNSQVPYVRNREIVEKLKENPEGLTFQQIFLDMRGFIY
jgi:hypothetical protein